MADQHYPRDVDDEGTDDTHVREALRDLAFLRPDGMSGTDPSGIDPMPDWAWARITTALAAEQADSVHRRPSRLARWGGGLVAASVAVVAVGVGVTAFQDSGSGGAVVAGSPADADAAVAFEGTELAASPLAKELAASRELSFASMVPPVFRLIDSATPYTAADLKDQVSDVLSSNGMAASSTAVEQVMAAPPAPMVTSDVPADGFTRSAESLRDCVTKLTQQPDSTALMVDRATFEGDAAAVVVTPEESTPPMDELEVMVVDPDCNLIMKVWIGLTR